MGFFKLEGHVFFMWLGVCVLVLCLWVLPMEVMGITGNASVSSSTSLRPSVVNFGALFTIDSVIGRSVKPAIAAAVDDVNADKSILRGTRLNLILHDTNCSGFLGTVEGKYSVSKFLTMHNYFRLGFKI